MGTADVRRTTADLTSCPARRNANETESQYVTASKQLVATRTAFSQKPFRQQGFVHNLSLHSPPVDPLVCPTRRPHATSVLSRFSKFNSVAIEMAPAHTANHSLQIKCAKSKREINDVIFPRLNLRRKQSMRIWPAHRSPPPWPR